MNAENMDSTKYTEVINKIFAKKTELTFDEEDDKLIKKLWKSYFKKRKGISRTSSDVWVASVLWLYSRLNFLWEYDKEWTQKSLGEMFQVRPKTIGDKCREITNLLKIKDWDDRFCRKEIAEKNPFKSMVMLESVKRLDKKGEFFRKTKEGIIALHKKKYSLMEIINHV